MCLYSVIIKLIIGDYMEKKRSVKEKRRIVIIVFLIVFSTVFLIKDVFSDWVQIMNNNNQIHTLTAQKQDLLNEEASLKAEVTKLENPEYVARYAREKFLYSMDDEIIIRVNQN